MNRRRAALWIVVVALVAPAFATVPAVAATPAEIVAALNAQRAANGIPADIAERPDWSEACRLHNEYQRLNGTLTHVEDPGLPGYTEDGAWAGRNSVLSSGSTWDNGNPFEHAPLHLDQLLAARTNEMGADEHDGYGCVTTFPGWNRPHPDSIVMYTYPGDGRAGVPPSETAAEGPFTPGDFVGLPQGTTTGPHLFVLLDGPWPWAEGKIISASLEDLYGPVEVRWVDNTSDVVGPYMATGGIIIPVTPLAGNMPYTATVTATAAGQTVTRSWTFLTSSGTESRALPRAVSLSRYRPQLPGG